MKNYMDDKFIVNEGAIILYSGNDTIMNVPARFMNMSTSKIGDGSFMESHGLQCVVLPPDIKEIGSRAFAYCRDLTSVFLPGKVTKIKNSAFSFCSSLRDITIYDLELTQSEYYTLKSSSNRTMEDVYVSREMPEFPVVEQIISSFNEAKPACRIPDDIAGLFCLMSIDEQKGAFSLDKNIPVIGFSVPSVPVTENNAFIEYIPRKHKEVYDQKSEQKNDWYVRTGKTPLKEKTIIFTFDDKETREANGKVFVKATLMVGYFFWQSAQVVKYDNKRYYVYRRYYLNSNPEIGFVRRDIALYTDKGLVKNREVAQTVYAKYKLLSIL